MFPPINEQMDLIRKGTADIVSEDELVKKYRTHVTGRSLLDVCRFEFSPEGCEIDEGQRDGKVGLSVLRDLQETAHQQNLPLASDMQWVLFSRGGFSDDLLALAEEQSNVQLISKLFTFECKA